MQFDWLSLTAFIIYSVVLTGMFVLLMIQQAGARRLKAQRDQALIDKFFLYGEIQNFKDAGGVAESESFVTYLSSSRESAYEYIAEVQTEIEGLIVAWNGLNQPPSSPRLNEAYQNLVAMLPKGKND